MEKKQLVKMLNRMYFDGDDVSLDDLNYMFRQARSLRAMMESEVADGYAKKREEEGYDVNCIVEGFRMGRENEYTQITYGEMFDNDEDIVYDNDCMPRTLAEGVSIVYNEESSSSLSRVLDMLQEVEKAIKKTLENYDYLRED